jgi:DNA-binding Lrp family transcriptional regulator
MIKKYNNLKAFFLIKISMREKTKLKIYLKNLKNVKSLYMVDKNYDFILEIFFKNLYELNQFQNNLITKFEILENNILYVIENTKINGEIS